MNSISDKIIVKVDEYVLSVIINNILNNAIKFTSNDGKIIISAQANETEIILNIRDTGVGMNQETINDLLSEKSISKPGTNHEHGTGLG